MIEAPTELRERNQWVCWRYEQREGEPKPTKVPVNANTGRLAKSTDPSTWSSYEVAISYLVTGRADGIGYVLSAEDPYAGVDLDHCRDPESGSIEQWAKTIVWRLASYTEISPSGTGLRIFVRGELPPHGRHKGNIEVYCQARFLTVTGDRYGAAPGVINDRHEELLAWHKEVFGEPVTARANGHAQAGTPTDLDDAELLERARSADNGSKFWSLWNGDWSSAYGSQSEADLALANFLAFWCGPDPGRIERLFELSGLMRDKWAASGLPRVDDWQGHRRTHGVLRPALAQRQWGAVWRGRQRQQRAATADRHQPLPIGTRQQRDDRHRPDRATDGGTEVEAPRALDLRWTRHRQDVLGNCARAPHRRR